MKDLEFWQLFGFLVKEFRKRRGYSQAQLGEMIGQSNTRISDIERARSVRSGIKDQTVADLIDALDIPAYRFLPLYKKFKRPPPRPVQIPVKRTVYLSCFDIDDDSALPSFQTCVLRLFAYGCFADTVSFQYSDPLKNRNLLQAITLFQLAFRMNEDWSPQPVFKLYTNGKTETFSDYLASRQAFLKEQPNNLETKSYEASNAQDGACELDNFFSDVTLDPRLGSVTGNLVARMKRFFSGSNGPKKNSAAYNVAYRYWNEPDTFQTFRFKNDIQRVQLHMDERTEYFLNNRLRRDYHAANAQSVSALTEEEFIWSESTILRIFDRLNVLRPLLIQLEEESADLNAHLFNVRKNPWFRMLKDTYFDCTTKQEIAIFEHQLCKALASESSQLWQQRSETAALRIMEWLGSKE